MAWFLVRLIPWCGLSLCCLASLLSARASYGNDHAWQLLAPALQEKWHDGQLQRLYAEEYANLSLLLQSLLVETDPIKQQLLQHEMDELAETLLAAMEQQARQQVVNLPYHRGMLLFPERMPVTVKTRPSSWLIAFNHLFHFSPLAILFAPGEVDKPNLDGWLWSSLAAAAQKRPHYRLYWLQEPEPHLALQRSWQFVSAEQLYQQSEVVVHRAQDYSMYLGLGQLLALQWHTYHPQVQPPVPQLGYEPSLLACALMEQTSQFGHFLQHQQSALPAGQEQAWYQLRHQAVKRCQETQLEPIPWAEQQQYQLWGYQLLHAALAQVSNPTLAQRLLALLDSEQAADSIYQQLHLLLRRQYYYPQAASELGHLVEAEQQHNVRHRVVAVLSELAMVSFLEQRMQHYPWLQRMYQGLTAAMYPEMAHPSVQATTDP